MKKHTHSVFICGWLSISLSGLLFLISQAIYADPEPVPPNFQIPFMQIDPARVKQNLQQPFQPAYRPSFSVPLVKKSPPQKLNPSAIKFILKGVTLEGVTVYKKGELEALYAKYLGKQVTLTDLQEIINAITVKYRNDGYILSKAYLPEQKIKNGVVRIVIIEGYISDYLIEGNARGSRKLIEAYGDKILADHPVNVKTLERYVLLINDIPGVDVKAVLSPSKKQFGATDIIFAVSEKRFDADVNYDNRGTRYIGPEQLAATIDINDAIAGADDFRLHGVATPTDNELRYSQIGYKRLLGANGLSLNLNGDYIQTKPGFILEPLNMIGRSSSWSTALDYPFLRSRRMNLITTMKFDWLDTESKIPLGKLYADSIRSLRFDGYVDYLDNMRGVSTLKAEFSKGLKAMGASASDDEALTSRLNGRADYSKVNLDVSRLQTLGSHFALLLAGSGQYSFNQPLLSAEEFGFGGVQYGRAYDPSAITGDNGMEGKAELQLNTYPGYNLLRSIQYYVFYDAGEVWNVGGQHQQEDRLSATSGGLGLRLYLNDHFYGNFELTKPLTYPVATLLADNKNGNSLRWFFSLNAQI